MNSKEEKLLEFLFEQAERIGLYDMAIDIVNSARDKKDPKSFKSVSETAINEAFDTIRKTETETNMEKKNERRNQTKDQ